MNRRTGSAAGLRTESWMRLDDAALYARVSVAQVLDAIQRGELPACRQALEPGGWLLNPELIESWASGRSTGGRP